jgi:uncharacterized membrane protein YqaE (UPF0057 family)
MKRIFTHLLAVAVLLSFIMPAANAIVIVPKRASLPDVTSIQAAKESFTSLSAKEKKAKFKEVAQAIKDYKAAKKAAAEPSTNTLLLVLVAILLPPLAVYLHEGVINNKFWIDLILTLLFYVPGLVYALIVILGDKT